MAVPSGPIVEHFDVIKYLRACFCPYCIDLSPDTLLLQAAVERLGYRIVVAVTALAHAGLQVVCRKKPCPVIAAILRTLIRVDNHPLLGTSPVQSGYVLYRLRPPALRPGPPHLVTGFSMNHSLMRICVLNWIEVPTKNVKKNYGAENGEKQ